MSEQIPNILVVDDVVANLAILSDIIQTAGYKPRPVKSVMQAEKAIEKCIPQLILLDVSMPEVDGFEFCSKLKNSIITRDIPVIFISAKSDTNDKVRAFELGAVDYISKPYEKAEVLHRITTHLKISSMQNQLEAYNRKLNSIINQQVKTIVESQRKLILSLSSVLCVTGYETEIHIERVSKICRLIALSLECIEATGIMAGKDFAHTIEISAKVHDIGCLRIDHKILDKPGKLSYYERKEVQKHSRIGEYILEEISGIDKENIFIKMAREIAISHHEKWDGSGYPYGLSETNIPLSARIMAVVDTYDVLRSEKCYKSAYSHEESISIIHSEAGRSFDPLIVKIFGQLEPQIVKYYN